VDQAIRYAHLLSMSVWLGGLIALGSIAAGLRRSGAQPEQRRAMARGYGRVAWPAIVVAVITGFWQAERLGVDMGRPAMITKLALVVFAVALAGVHQITARRTSPALRGLVQGLILAVTLGVLAAAVAL
jgi:putative copper export protein